MLTPYWPACLGKFSKLLLGGSLLEALRKEACP